RKVDSGSRPGHIFKELDWQTLATSTTALVSEKKIKMGAQAYAAIDDLAKCVRTHDTENFKHQFRKLLGQLGLQRVIKQIVVPLNQFIGQEWQRGALTIFDEHLYSEALQTELRIAMSNAKRIEANIAAPRILLTSLPGEQHGIGLLMVQALASIQGADCIAPGMQMPVSEIVSACKASKANIVALSISGAYPTAEAQNQVNELRKRIDERTAIWLGGAGAQRIRMQKNHDGVIGDLTVMENKIADWRKRHHLQIVIQPI
ncbi:MAG: cobalamin B12-binding domain-containing protein, partial [Burkholderiales bacterium]